MVNAIIDENKIQELLEQKASQSEIDEILNKALSLKGISLKEASVLLNIEGNDNLNKLYKTAKLLKEKIYGNRIVLFAPLYLSNYCTNNCLYCGFRFENKSIKRKKLTIDEAINETRRILETGHKRILLVAGEDTTQCNLNYIEELINKIYEQKLMNGEIRRININIAPLSVEEFKKLSSFGIGTYQSFQETYYPQIYKKMHPQGLKSNYEWRLETMSRAFEGGLQDVGMGVLFGLTDYRFEVLALLMHSQYLEKNYGIGPHTISIPRIEPAEGSDVASTPPNVITDENFKKIISVLRLAVPYTGIILSTRERAEFRRELLELGISQISAGSKTNPGGYSQEKATEQFSIGDTRSLDEVIYELTSDGYLPSFCTSCYRVGRVGKDFMDLAKPGLIQKFCHPNAIITFKEYLIDYAADNTKVKGNELINKFISNMQDSKQKELLLKDLQKIGEGTRDIYR